MVINTEEMRYDKHEKTRAANCSGVMYDEDGKRIGPKDLDRGIKWMYWCPNAKTLGWRVTKCSCEIKK